MGGLLQWGGVGGGAELQGPGDALVLQLGDEYFGVCGFYSYS